MPPDPKKSTIVPGKRESFTNEPTTAEYGKLTVQDLNIILEVNQKALTIYLEVEKQNEAIIESIQATHQKLGKIEEIEDYAKEIIQGQKDASKAVKDLDESMVAMKKSMEELDKNFFRLIIILGSAGIGTVVTIIQNLLNKK